MNFCFVILHYRTADDTIECIESIEKLNGVFNIVIVDNASNNGSIEEVEKLVGNRQNIYIIKNIMIFRVFIFNLKLKYGKHHSYIYISIKIFNCN